VGKSRFFPAREFGDNSLRQLLAVGLEVSLVTDKSSIECLSVSLVSRSRVMLSSQISDPSCEAVAWLS